MGEFLSIWCEEFGLEYDKVLKLKKLLYGLTEIDDYWSRSLRKYLDEELGMNQCTLDPVVFCNLNSGSLPRMCAIYVDDALDKEMGFTRAS